MKKLFLFLIVMLAAVASFAQAKKKTAAAPAIKQYWFVMLTKGKNRDQDSATIAKLQDGHINSINSLYKAGKLKVAGPFGDEGDWQGIFIFDCPTKEEVIALLKKDPAIAAARLDFEIHPWYTMPTGSFAPGKPKG